jgi:hypothetical protein
MFVHYQCAHDRPAVQREEKIEADGSRGAAISTNAEKIA